MFAIVSVIKKNDGRIYGRNREYINSIRVNPEMIAYKLEKPIIYAGLDDIHSAHINQLIGAIRNYEMGLKR